MCTSKIYYFYLKQFLCEYSEGKIIYDSIIIKGYFMLLPLWIFFRRRAFTFSHTSIKEIVIKQSDSKYEYFKHVNFIVLVCKFVVQFNFWTNPFSLDSHIFKTILSHRDVYYAVSSAMWRNHWTFWILFALFLRSFLWLASSRL